MAKQFFCNLRLPCTWRGYCLGHRHQTTIEHHWHVVAHVFFLKPRLFKLEWVEKLSQFLLANLGFFFVPPGVAIMLYLDVIQKELWPIVMATVLSTILVLVVTGHMHQFVVKAERKIMAMNLRKKQKTKENSKRRMCFRRKRNTGLDNDKMV